MKVKAIFSLLMIFFCNLSFGQKIIVGSDVPAFRILKDNVHWVNASPEDGNNLIIEFYQSENPSSVKDFDRLISLSSTLVGTSVLVLVRDSEQAEKIKSRISENMFLAIDSTDNGFFGKCYVKYIPYTMIVSARNKLLWHGVLSSISDETINVKIGM